MAERSPPDPPLALFAFFFLLLAALPPLAGWLLGDPSGFDRFLLRVLRDPADPFRPVWDSQLIRVFRLASVAGSFPFLALASLLLAAGLRYCSHRREAFLLPFAVASAALTNLLLKLLFARPRPSIVPPLAEPEGWSFPSGHATLSAAFALTAAQLLRPIAATVPAWLLDVAALVFLLLVGVSRIVLGVHYPSDVATGWLLGTLWAIMASALTRSSSRCRGRILRS